MSVQIETTWSVFQRAEKKAEEVQIEIARTVTVDVTASCPQSQGVQVHWGLKRRGWWKRVKCNQLFRENDGTFIRNCSNCNEKRFFGAGVNTPHLTIQYYFIELYIGRLVLIPAYAASCSVSSISERISNSQVNFGDILQGNMFLDQYGKLTRTHKLDYILAFVFHNDSIKLLDFPVAKMETKTC